MRWLVVLLLVFGAASRAFAGDVVAGAADDVSVTIYRDPGRSGGAINLANLGGFAVVSETRTVTLPAGKSRLRFVGVVDGIVPASAVLSGLPAGIIERNQDSALLSPASLLRAARGKRITLLRTDPATGKRVQTAADIVSASESGVVFHTAEGEMALRCSGYPETFRYSHDAEGLFAQPTLSVMVNASRPINVRVTLTYLAQGFDWNASYTARLNADGGTIDLGGWITLANGNSVSLQDARVQIVAGRLNRAVVDRIFNNTPAAIARCWPMATTSDIPERPGRPYELVQPYRERGFVRRRGYGMANDIVVTSRKMDRPMMMAPAPVAAISAEAVQEQLGDLKMYRVPRLTSVAANQMKQTRLLERSGVGIERYYTASIYIHGGEGIRTDTAVAMLRTRNDKQHALGLPLPAGAFLIDQMQFGRPMVLAEPTLNDTATDEKVELALGVASDVTVQTRCLKSAGGKYQMETTISNAGMRPITVELEISNDVAMKVVDATFPVVEKDGKRLMILQVPAQGSVVAGYSGTYQ